MCPTAYVHLVCHCCVPSTVPRRCVWCRAPGIFTCRWVPASVHEDVSSHYLPCTSAQCCAPSVCSRCIGLARAWVVSSVWTWHCMPCLCSQHVCLVSFSQSTRQAGLVPCGCLLWCGISPYFVFCVPQSTLSIVLWCVLLSRALAVCTWHRVPGVVGWCRFSGVCVSLYSWHECDTCPQCPCVFPVCWLSLCAWLCVP